MEGLNSNLNLNGNAPPSVTPGLGEWAPLQVPSTRAKKAMRIKVILALIVALAAVVGFGWFVWSMMQ